MSNNPSQQRMMKMMFTYILPPVIFLTTAWLPAGLQWFFLCLTATTVVQTTATLNPVVRRWADIPPLTSEQVLRGVSPIVYQPPTPQNPAETNGIMDNISKGFQQSLGQDDRKKSWGKAKEYEERRAAEEKEKALRRMEEARRKRAEKRRQR